MAPTIALLVETERLANCGPAFNSAASERSGRRCTPTPGEGFLGSVIRSFVEIGWNSERVSSGTGFVYSNGSSSEVDEIEADGIEQNVPAMTLQELYIGVGASDLPERERRRIEYVVESRPLLPTTEETPRKAGRIDGQPRKQGERIDLGDAAIGATGVVRDEAVVTENPEHFERIPGLDVESY